MSNARDMTPAAVIASQALDGQYGVCQCVELPFGAQVRQVPASNPPRQDATVTWLADGAVIVETSIDDGRTWETVDFPGDVIKQLPIGRSVTGLALLVRQRYRANATGTAFHGRVATITVNITLTDGTTIARTETGPGDLALGSHYGTEVANSAVRPAALPTIALNGAYLIRQITPHGQQDPGSPPLDGLKCWLNAESLRATHAHGALVSLWHDDSNHGNDAVQATGGNQPNFRATEVNGQEGAVRFVAANANYMTLPNFLTGQTSGEIFIVVKTTADPNANHNRTGLWNMGPTTQPPTHYPWTDNQIYESFGTTDRVTVGDMERLNTWRVYNVSSATNDWKARLDTVVVKTDTTNAVAWPVNPRIGGSLSGDNSAGFTAHLDGDVAEVLIYESVRTALQRAQVHEYLRRRYALSYAITSAEQTTTDLHVSHGTRPDPGGVGGNPSEFQQGDDNDPAGPIVRQAFDDASMAWEMWFQLADDAPSRTQTLIGWNGYIGGGNRPTMLCTLEPSGDDFYLRTYVLEQARRVGGTFSGGVIVREYLMRTAGAPIRRGRWHHVAWSYDGLWSTLYLDTSVVGQMALRSGTGGAGNEKKVMGIVIETKSDVALGGSPVSEVPLSHAQYATRSTRFVGRLDEIRIWSRRLTPGEILRRAHYQLSDADVTALAATGLRAYYRCDTPGSELVDLSGRGLNFPIVDRPHAAFEAASRTTWRGVPVGPTADASSQVEYAPARVSPPLALDVPSNVLRLTNAPFDVTFPDGRVFTGAGDLGAISASQEPGDLQPSGMEMALSGLPVSLVSIAIGTDYAGRPCNVYHAQFDANGAIVEDPWLIFGGLIDQIGVNLNQTATINLTAESYLRNWERPAGLRWNHQTQLAAYPDDFGLEFLQETADKEVWWPAKVSQDAEPPNTNVEGE